MRISTKGRYALRVMIDLARNGKDGFVKLQELSARQQISEKYLEGILGALVRGKLLEGVRGKGGGYRLNVRPEDCSVEVVCYASGLEGTRHHDSRLPGQR